MLTQEQREERRKGIGGSDMSVILGLSNYKTPYQLFLEKTGQIDDTQEESQVQYWGHKLEPLIIEEFKGRHDVQISKPDTTIHPFHAFMRANVDGFIDEYDSVLEAKSSTAFKASEWGEDGSDMIPMEYLCQVVHYVSCLNAKGAYLAVLIGGNDYREFVYTRDLQLENYIINAAKTFWERVQNHQAPAPSDFDDLKLLYPQSDAMKQKPCDPVSRETWEKLANLKQQKKELEEQEKQYRFELMEYMEDCEALVDDNGKPLATWKSNKRGTRTFLIKGVK